MVVTATTEKGAARGRLRPLDPTRDMGAIAQLIGSAFGEDMDSQGRAALRDMRWMSRLSPLVWWWAQADPSFRETYNGFVWEEPSSTRKDRRTVVGNANLMPSPGNRYRWVICNVVVQEEYRRRGIARRLMEEALAEAQRQGAEEAVLQVYKDNLAALRLYTGLGFQQVAGEMELYLAEIGPVAMLDAPGYELRPYRPGTSQEGAYDLASRAIPMVQQWLKPVRVGEYEPDWLTRLGWRLAELAAGRRRYRLMAFKGDEPAAMMSVEASFRRQAHSLKLLIHPKHRGQLEPMLVSRALTMLAGLPVRAVQATVITDHTAAIQALGQYGFREQRTLLTMSYKLTKRDVGHEQR
ncbi:MAG: GNAT family N-acetyltransferase [Anaerolineae bacterium]|nr:GNAT family N-acetyltransferase [Anaerolineae bacterium]